MLSRVLTSRLASYQKLTTRQSFELWYNLESVSSCKPQVLPDIHLYKNCSLVYTVSDSLTSDPQLPSLRPRGRRCGRGIGTARWSWGWASQGWRLKLLSPWTSCSHVLWSNSATGWRSAGKKESSGRKSATEIITETVAPPPRASSRSGWRNDRMRERWSWRVYFVLNFEMLFRVHGIFMPKWKIVSTLDGGFYSEMVTDTNPSSVTDHTSCIWGHSSVSVSDKRSDIKFDLFSLIIHWAQLYCVLSSILS